MAIKDIYQAVIGFDQSKVAELTQAELDAGTDIESVLNEGLIGAMDEVGKKFSEGELFVPEMLMAAQAMKAGLNLLRPLLANTDTKPMGTVVIGTVKGDLHDIGKNLVAMMMEGAGFLVVDLGVDVDSEKFMAAAKENNADIVALSALLTTTMPVMKQTVDVFAESGMRDQVKIIIGGAPVTDAYAKEIGADGYGADAPSAVDMARSLLAA